VFLFLQHFNNEKYEIKQYDAAMKDYEKSSVKIATSLALLNSGQGAIFSSALTVMMYLAAKEVLAGKCCPYMTREDTNRRSTEVSTLRSSR
jgi:ABC-type transport system involved in Fe-S cluster assembly fused permease/ATPase subunit